MLILFIIIQGPKGAGMINSMNGARSRTHARSHAPGHARAARRMLIRPPFARARVCFSRNATESRMFGNFSETKNFVTIGTWGLVLGFLLLSAIVSIKH
jgi:hypothetical protein